MGEGRSLHKAQPRQGLTVLIVDYSSKILLIKIVISSEAVRIIPIYLFSPEVGEFSHFLNFTNKAVFANVLSSLQICLKEYQQKLIIFPPQIASKFRLLIFIIPSHPQLSMCVCVVCTWYSRRCVCV